MSFGDWLRSKLIDREWSNAKLARRVGVSGTHIGNLVRGYSPNKKDQRATPTRSMVLAIAKALGEDEKAALQAAGYLPKLATQPDKDIERFLTMLHKLPVDRRKDAIRFMTTYLNTIINEKEDDDDQDTEL